MARSKSSASARRPSRGVRKGEIVDFETAMKCVHEAVVDAEEKSDVMIRSVYVGVAGSHIQSFNNRGCVTLAGRSRRNRRAGYRGREDQRARSQHPARRTPFCIRSSSIITSTGRTACSIPVGMLGQKLEADFHIIHGVRNAHSEHHSLRERIAARCRRRGLQRARRRAGCADSTSEKSRRARDRYRRRHDRLHSLCRWRGETERRARASAAITLPTTSRWGLRIPMTRAEKLKIEEGSVDARQLSAGRNDFAERRFRFCRERNRARNAQHHHSSAAAGNFRAALKRQLEEEPFINYIGEGIFITGGCSHLNGIDHLAEEIFEMPAHVAHAQTMSGLTSAFENPQFSAAIGLIKYAQAVQADRQPRGRLRPNFRKIFQRNAMNQTTLTTSKIMIQLSHNYSLPEQEGGRSRDQSRRRRRCRLERARSHRARRNGARPT